MRLRRMGFLLFALAPLLVSGAVAQQTDRAFEVAKDSLAPPVAAAAPAMIRGMEATNNYGPQKISFPDGVSAMFDIAYATLPGYRPLTLDL